MTLALCGIICLSASVAFSARNSCQNEKIALMKMTAKIAQPSWGMPATNARMPPTHSMIAKRW